MRGQAEASSSTDEILYGITDPRDGGRNPDPGLPAWWPQKIELGRLSMYGRYSIDRWVGSFGWVAKAEQFPDEWLEQEKRLIDGASKEFIRNHEHWMQKLAALMTRPGMDLLEASQAVDLERRIEDEDVWIGVGTQQQPKVFLAVSSRLAAVETLAGRHGEWRYLHLPGDDILGPDDDHLIYIREGELHGNVELET